MANKILGASSLSGYLGDAPDWVNISCPNGRTLQSVLTNGTIQYYRVEATQKTGGQLLADGNYANPVSIAGNSLDNANVIKAILVSEGYSGEYGYFADGFTLNDLLDVGIDASFQLWKYIGAETIPYNVPPLTDPNAGDWELVLFKNYSADFEILDLNYDQPFRKASDYVVTVAVLGILHTGQSLAEGGTDGAVISDVTTPSYPDRVLMFSPRPVGLSSTNLSAVTDDLVEATRVTIGHSLTRNLAVGNDDIILFSGQAWGGQPYSTLKKGGSTGVYEATIQQVVNAKALYPTIVYKAVTNIHGEQDGLNNNTNYALDLNEWRNDYDTDIKSVTGQTDDVVMYIDQTSSGSGYGFNGGINELTFPSPLEQLKAHENYPNIILVCPKYFLDYADHSHITNLSQRILGEYHAKAQKLGNAYSPLRPSSVNGSGSSVVIDFVGNVGALAFDTTKVNATTNMGFSYVDDSGRTITSVTITGASQVTLTLDGVIGTNPVAAYAYHNGDGGAANQIAGLGDRGNLRDSDTTQSLYDPSYILHNWCVSFREEVTVQ